MGVFPVEYEHYLHIKKENNPKQRNTDMRFGRFEVFTAVTMKNGVFWDVTPCSCN
jgi:hypothetical protein